MQKNSNADNKRTSVADFEFSLNNPQLLAVDEKKRRHNKQSSPENCVREDKPILATITAYPIILTINFGVFLD